MGAIETNRIQFVRQAYNRIAEKYDADRDQSDNRDLLEAFAARVPPGGRILDIGCGAGAPVGQFLLAQQFRVVGIDISDHMLALARTRIPTASFAQMDMARMGFKEQVFDGLISCYAIFHVPREQHQAIFHQLRSVLKKDRPALLVIGFSAWEGTEDFHGTEMFWSHYQADHTIGLLQQEGFEVHRKECRSREGDGTHCWILAS